MESLVRFRVPSEKPQSETPSGITAKRFGTLSEGMNDGMGGINTPGKPVLCHIQLCFVRIWGTATTPVILERNVSKSHALAVTLQNRR